MNTAGSAGLLAIAYVVVVLRLGAKCHQTAFAELKHQGLALGLPVEFQAKRTHHGILIAEGKAVPMIVVMPSSR